MFDHNNESTLAACGLTKKDVAAAIKKLHDEISNKPFLPYTATDKRALLVLAVKSNKALLANTLNFVDESIFDSVDSNSKLVEALEKYPPTFDQVVAVLAVRELKSLPSDD